MPKLRWDQTGERLYETGIDQGVLYLPDGRAVAWNGLTGIEEDSPEDSEPFYMDGIKFYDRVAIEDYTATLRALTYPDEFLPFDGFQHLGGGLIADDQPLKRFSLSYRTLVGNDAEGQDHGYKIHLVYNLTALPEDKSYETLSENTEALELSWEISGVPQRIIGYKPTAHVIIDSTRIHRVILRRVESILYGIDDVIDGGSPFSPGPNVNFELSGDSITLIDGGFPDTEHDEVFDAENAFRGGRLPSIQELVDYMSNPLITVEDHGDGTWTVTGPDELIDSLDPVTFQIHDIDVVPLEGRTYEITDSYGA